MMSFISTWSYAITIRLRIKRSACFVATICLLICSPACRGQDSVRVDTTAFHYKLDLGFGSYYQFSSFGSTNRNEAVIPQKFYQARRPYFLLQMLRPLSFIWEGGLRHPRPQ